MRTTCVQYDTSHDKKKVREKRGPQNNETGPSRTRGLPESRRQNTTPDPFTTSGVGPDPPRTVRNLSPSPSSLRSSGTESATRQDKERGGGPTGDRPEVEGQRYYLFRPPPPEVSTSGRDLCTCLTRPLPCPYAAHTRLTLKGTFQIEVSLISTLTLLTLRLWRSQSCPWIPTVVGSKRRVLGRSAPRPCFPSTHLGRRRPPRYQNPFNSLCFTLVLLFFFRLFVSSFLCPSLPSPSLLVPRDVGLLRVPRRNRVSKGLRRGVPTVVVLRRFPTVTVSGSTGVVQSGSFPVSALVFRPFTKGSQGRRRGPGGGVRRREWGVPRFCRRSDGSRDVGIRKRRP